MISEEIYIKRKNVRTVGEIEKLNNGYTITSVIKNNPANDKEFIKTAQDFTITIEITLTNKTGNSVIVEKNVNAKVVEVVGKIINRKSYMKIDKSFRYDDFDLDDHKLDDYIHGFQTKLKAQLLDGTIIDVIGYEGQGGGVASDFTFGMGLGSIYDLKYILEDSTNPSSLETVVLGYFIDKDNNIVDLNGNITVPFEKREVKAYSSTNDEIKLNAKIGTFPDSATLESKVRTDLNLDKQYVAYDMNVICNGEYIQPVGSVDLAITLPDTLLNKKLGVYYLDEQGNLEELDSMVNGNIVSFSTTHFSTYVVMEKVENSEQITENTKNEDISSTKDAIKNTAQDNLNSSQGTIITLLALVIVGSAIALKRKHS